MYVSLAGNTSLLAEARNDCSIGESLREESDKYYAVRVVIRSPSEKMRVATTTAAEQFRHTSKVKYKQVSVKRERGCLLLQLFFTLDWRITTWLL
jgi:hypothetical protein